MIRVARDKRHANVNTQNAAPAQHRKTTRSTTAKRRCANAKSVTKTMSHKQRRRPKMLAVLPTQPCFQTSPCSERRSAGNAARTAASSVQRPCSSTPPQTPARRANKDTKHATPHATITLLRECASNKRDAARCFHARSRRARHVNDVNGAKRPPRRFCRATKRARHRR